jgi:hypothetical protein
MYYNNHILITFKPTDFFPKKNHFQASPARGYIYIFISLSWFTSAVFKLKRNFVQIIYGKLNLQRNTDHHPNHWSDNAQCFLDAWHNITADALYIYIYIYTHTHTHTHISVTSRRDISKEC